MTTEGGTTQAIIDLARDVRELQQRAEQVYRPVVDAILHAGRRDAEHIERTLDGLLDFCGHEPVLAMFKQLCRHYGASTRRPQLTKLMPTANDGVRRRVRARATDGDEGLLAIRTERRRRELISIP